MRSEPDEVDVHVGNRVRLRRKELGLSQVRLAQSLGIAFQQVQKYECGTNRISASRLFKIAQVLRVRVDSFFEGLDKPPWNEGGQYTTVCSRVLEEFFAEPDGPELAEAFVRIHKKSIRRGIVNLTFEIANIDGANP